MIRARFTKCTAGGDGPKRAYNMRTVYERSRLIPIGARCNRAALIYHRQTAAATAAIHAARNQPRVLVPRHRMAPVPRRLDVLPGQRDNSPLCRVYAATGTVAIDATARDVDRPQRKQLCELTDGGACVSDGSGNYGNNENCVVQANARLCRERTRLRCVSLLRSHHNPWLAIQRRPRQCTHRRDDVKRRQALLVL